MTQLKSRINRIAALHLAADYRLDVKKFWVDDDGNYSVWFYSEADKEDVMDGKFSWDDVTPDMKLCDLLDVLLRPEPRRLVQTGLQKRPRTFLEARLACLTRKIGDLVC